MDRYDPNNYQDELDEDIRVGMATPSQPGNLADDAQRQAYLDQLTAQLLAQLQLNIPQPDYSRPTPPMQDQTGTWPASGAPRMRRY